MPATAVLTTLRATVQVVTDGACARSWVYISGGPQTTFNPNYRIRSDAASVMNIAGLHHRGFLWHSTCGRVTQLNASLLGTNGLVRTNLCATVGDSGAPTAVNTAFGLMKGQWSVCDTLYEPIRRAENLMNVDVTHALD